MYSLYSYISEASCQSEKVADEPLYLNWDTKLYHNPIQPEFRIQQTTDSQPLYGPKRMYTTFDLTAHLDEHPNETPRC